MRDKALLLLFEYTKGDSLRKHALAVEASMVWYAREFFKLDQSEIDRWGVCGLLHDFDYESFPEEHPRKGNQILIEAGYDREITDSILGHCSLVPRTTDMAKTLFAVDELCGLITASVYVRPDKSIATLEVSSVNKKMKDKAFARGCNREDIRLGASELGLDLSIHIGNVISAMREKASDLGL